MKIDLGTGPPPEIFRHRTLHRLAAALLLLLVLGACVLMAYGILSDAPQSETLESVAMVLFVGPALLFSYFGSKLNGYKRLSSAEKNLLTNFRRKHPEIDAYCLRLEELGREMTHAEFEACRELDEDREHRR